MDVSKKEQSQEQLQYFSVKYWEDGVAIDEPKWWSLWIERALGGRLGGKLRQAEPEACYQTFR